MAVRYKDYKPAPRVGNCLLYMGLGMKPRPSFPRDSEGFEPLEAYFPKDDYSSSSLSDTDSEAEAEELKLLEKEKQKSTGVPYTIVVSPQQPLLQLPAPPQPVPKEPVPAPKEPVPRQPARISSHKPAPQLSSKFKSAPQPSSNVRPAPQPSSNVSPASQPSNISPAPQPSSNFVAPIFDAEVDVRGQSPADFNAPVVPVSGEEDVEVLVPSASGKSGRDDSTTYYSPELAYTTVRSPSKDSRLAPSKLNFSSEEGDLSGEGTFGDYSDLEPESREGTRVRKQPNKSHRKEVTVVMDRTEGNVRIAIDAPPHNQGSPLVAPERMCAPPTRNQGRGRGRPPKVRGAAPAASSEEENEVDEIMSNWRPSRFQSLHHLSRTKPAGETRSAGTSDNVGSTQNATETRGIETTGEFDYESEESAPPPPVGRPKKAPTGSTGVKKSELASRETNCEKSEGNKTKLTPGRPRKISHKITTASRGKSRMKTAVVDVVRTKVVETSTFVHSSRMRDTSHSHSSKMWFTPEDFSMARIRKAAKSGRQLSPRRLRSRDEGGSGAETTEDEHDVPPQRIVPKKLKRRKSRLSKKNVTFSEILPMSDADDAPDRRSGGKQGVQHQEPVRRSGGKRGVQHQEPDKSGSDSDTMPRLKRRRGRQRRHPEEVMGGEAGEMGAGKRERGSPRKVHPAEGGVDGSPSTESDGGAYSRDENANIEVMSTPGGRQHRRLEVDPAEEGGVEESPGTESDGGAYSRDENANIEVVSTPGGRQYRRLEVARPTNPTPGVRRSKRARIPPIQPGQQIEYNLRRESGVSLQGILVPLERESKGRGEKKKAASLDADFPLLDFVHRVTKVPIRTKVMYSRNSAFRETARGDEPEEGGSDVIVEKLVTEKFVSMGFLIFPPSAEKESCDTDCYDMYFVVTKGRVLFEINRTPYEADARFGEVKVPSGTTYSIVNLRNSPAEVHYTALCVVTDT